MFIVNSSYPDINIQWFDVCDYFSSMIKKDEHSAKHMESV